MQVQSLRIPDIKLLIPRRFTDDRGWFSESYNQATMATAGFDLDFVQDNHSYSKPAGTVRGLHYQSPPFAQDKLVRVLRGRILDVAVDIRVGSPTYGDWLSAELTAGGGEQLLVPIGFLHGFITLEDDTEVAYKVTARYSADCDGNVRWDDPGLGIDWGELADRAVLSEKDLRAPSWIEFESPFR
tara:strand:- start:3830 stop:4384 length:555 start_codon:yes stop_codon:yes gene_type:complete